MNNEQFKTLLDAIEERGRKSDAAHEQLLSMIPKDHVAQHEKISEFMGRLDASTHLNHHEFVEPWAHTSGIIRDQIAKNIGNVISVIFGLGAVLYVAQWAGLLK